MKFVQFGPERRLLDPFLPLAQRALSAHLRWFAAATPNVRIGRTLHTPVLSCAPAFRSIPPFGQRALSAVTGHSLRKLGKVSRRSRPSSNPPARHCASRRGRPPSRLALTGRSLRRPGERAIARTARGRQPSLLGLPAGPLSRAGRRAIAQAGEAARRRALRLPADRRRRARQRGRREPGEAVRHRTAAPIASSLRLCALTCPYGTSPHVTYKIAPRLALAPARKK